MYQCIDYLRENLSNSYEVAESIEIVNISGRDNGRNNDQGGKKKDKEKSSQGDWKDTYKEIFESKDLFVIKGMGERCHNKRE